MSKVSIITPCYNSAKYILETASSVIQQSYTNWEWIICDDCSTDESVSLVESLQEERIILLKNKTNVGAATSRNNALEIASGRFITFLDSDDIWDKEFLKKTTEFLIRRNVSAVFTSYSRKNELLEPYLPDFIADEKINLKRVLRNCPVPMLSSMYDTNQTRKVPFPLVQQREDWAMWINFLKTNDYVYPLNEVLATYRIRENSYSSNKTKIAKLTFYMFHEFVGFSKIKSLYFTSCWALNGVQKYWIGRKNKN